MNSSFPVYTADAQCQDCYKCVRHCPSQAIGVIDNKAHIIDELCVCCGNCVQVCPAGAKRVRDDRTAVEALLRSAERVYVSLAPSWSIEFPDISAAQMISALKALGFTGVSETALGAQESSALIAARMRKEGRGLFISSACPAASEYIRKYLPEFGDNIVNLKSPVGVHSDMLRRRYGSTTKVVMVSPCIAKKSESDVGDGPDYALTFSDLRHWFLEQNIDAATLGADGGFEPHTAEEGALYPIEGGMIETIKMHAGVEDAMGITLSGLNRIDDALQKIDKSPREGLIFLELLACSGGCANGPCMEQGDAGIASAITVRRATRFPTGPRPADFGLQIAPRHRSAARRAQQPSPEQLAQALASVGKYSADDELNCGGCGYDSCSRFATALIANKAEPAMCVSFLRKQAQKKANGLLRCIPSGVVIVDATLTVIECNRRFAELFKEILYAYDARPGLAGADLKRIVSFHAMFSDVLKSGCDSDSKSLRIDGQLFDISVFVIEPGQVVGAVISDVSQSQIKREQIAGRAREVIEKNLSTVQEIACMLGEHMADTEILLRDIADDYAE